MNHDVTFPCSINACTRMAVHEESATSAHWLLTIHYCDEHQREINEGTPVGPVGIDPCRIEVHALGVEEPQTGGITPSLSPH